MRARQVPPAVLQPHAQWEKMYLEPGVLSIKVQHAQGLKDTKLLPMTKQHPQCMLEVGQVTVLSRVAKGAASAAVSHPSACHSMPRCSHCLLRTCSAGPSLCSACILMSCVCYQKAR